MPKVNLHFKVWTREIYVRRAPYGIRSTRPALFNVTLNGFARVVCLFRKRRSLQSEKNPFSSFRVSVKISWGRSSAHVFAKKKMTHHIRMVVVV